MLATTRNTFPLAEMVGIIPRAENIFKVTCYLCLEGQLMMLKKLPMSHTVPTRSILDLPNTEKDLTESTSVVPAKDLLKVKSEESSNNVKEYQF